MMSVTYKIKALPQTVSNYRRDTEIKPSMRHNVELNIEREASISFVITSSIIYSDSIQYC